MANSFSVLLSGAMFEEFHLSQPFLRLGKRFVRTESSQFTVLHFRLAHDYVFSADFLNHFLCFVRSASLYFIPDFGAGGNFSPFTLVISLLVLCPDDPIFAYCADTGTFCPGLNVLAI